SCGRGHPERGSARFLLRLFECQRSWISENSFCTSGTRRPAAGDGAGASAISHSACRDSGIRRTALRLFLGRKFSVEPGDLGRVAVVLLWLCLRRASSIAAKERNA